jgi:hypothetical protein
MFDWDELVQFAENVLQAVRSGKPVPEGVIRGAVSRAYYGAWNITRVYAEKRPSGVFSVTDWYVRQTSAPKTLPYLVNSPPPGFERGYRKAGSHERVIYSLQSHEEGLRIRRADRGSQMLFEMKNRRTWCDYGDVLPEDLTEMLEDSVAEAREVVKYIKSLP